MDSSAGELKHSHGAHFLGSATRTVIVLMGGACLDIVLEVDEFPGEDGETRATAVRTSIGGNATNSAVVLSQLLSSFQHLAWSSSSVNTSLQTRVALIAAISDPTLDANSGTLVKALSSAGVSTDGLVVVAPLGLPTSYITASLSSGSRTIVHYRGIPEYSEHTLKSAFGKVLTSADIDVHGSQCQWFHAEGRSIAATGDLLRQLQTHGSCVESQAAECGARLLACSCPPILSLEIEKHRSDGDVESLMPYVDIVFLSREYASGYLRHDTPAAALSYIESRIDAIGTAPEATDTSHRLLVRARPQCVILPWGTAGAYATFRTSELPPRADKVASPLVPVDAASTVAGCTENHPGWIRVHRPSHSPKFSCARTDEDSAEHGSCSQTSVYDGVGCVVDTIGAGDTFIAAIIAAVLAQPFLARALLSHGSAPSMLPSVHGHTCCTPTTNAPPRDCVPAESSPIAQVSGMACACTSTSLTCKAGGVVSTSTAHRTAAESESSISVPEQLVKAWTTALDFACFVAGEKVGIRGFDLSPILHLTAKALVHMAMDQP